MYTQTEKVNIEPKSYLPVFRISQNDVGRTLKAHLISDDGEITIPTSATVTMAGIKPSGLGYTVTGTINGSDVTFETDAVMTDEAGQIESEIRIVDGETLIGTTNVVLNVEPNPHPDDTTDGQREPLVNEITALLNQITAQADRVEEYSSKVLNMTVSAHESQEPTVTKTEGEVVNLDFGLPRGEKGERGERGEQGEAGKDGKDGLDGKDGKDGKDGINGVTPDFSIGTVTTLEPNESASVTLTGTEEEPVLNFGIPRGVKGEQGDVSLSDLEKVMVTDTASGAIASFPDGSDLLPAKSLIANIVPKQSGSGTPSPENIRPISGWTEVTVFVSPTEDEEDATTHTTDLGRTVYGGTVDVVSGTLTVTHALVDLGTLNWATASAVGHVRFDAGINNLAPNPTDNLEGYGSGLYCEIYATDGHPITNNSVDCAIARFGNRVYIRDDRYSSAADFKTAMNGVQLCYELSTPTTYQLTPQTINTLSGVNNVWADSGDCSITYYADTKLYIDKKLGGN